MGFIVGIYQEKKDYPTAIDITRKMIAIDPKSDKFHFTLGALLDETKQKEAGVDEMKKAIELNPKNAQALNYLGYTYAESGQNLDEAESLIKRALKVEPEDGFYVDSLGWVYYQKGEYKRAVEELERAVNYHQQRPTITEHLGDAYRKMGKLKEASRTVRRRAQKVAGERSAIAPEGQDSGPAHRDGRGRGLRRPLRIRSSLPRRMPLRLRAPALDARAVEPSADSSRHAQRPLLPKLKLPQRSASSTFHR